MNANNAGSVSCILLCWAKFCWKLNGTHNGECRAWRWHAARRPWEWFWKTNGRNKSNYVDPFQRRKKRKVLSVTEGKLVYGEMCCWPKCQSFLISGSLISFIFAHNKGKASQSICHGPISGICRGFLSQFARFSPRSSTSYSFPVRNLFPAPRPLLISRFYLLFLSTFSAADRHIGARRPLGAPGCVTSTVGSDVGHQQQPQQHGVGSVGGAESRERRDTARSASWAADYSHGE